MNHKTRFFRNFESLSAAERDAVTAAILMAQSVPDWAHRQKMVRRVIAVVNAKERTQARAASDAVTDHVRRATVGARVRREYAERCRAAAERSNRSLYRFVLDALAAELLRVENGVENSG